VATIAEQHRFCDTHPFCSLADFNVSLPSIEESPTTNPSVLYSIAHPTLSSLPVLSKMIDKPTKLSHISAAFHTVFSIRTLHTER